MSRPVFNVAWTTGWPEVDAIGAEIRRLQRERDEMVADRLLGRTRVKIGGMEFVTDPAVPPNTIEVRDAMGRVIHRIVNVEI